jgi:hypothetical protein
MKGLISAAARLVAFATNLLIETADGRRALRRSLVRVTHCRVERGGRTAQLIAVSRVTCQAVKGQSHVQGARMPRSRCEGRNLGAEGTLEFKKRDTMEVEILYVWRGNLVLPDIGWGRCVVMQVSHGGRDIQYK